jgi:hypothetical protein
MRARLSGWIRAALTGTWLWRRRVEANGSASVPVWCVVANVAESRPYGVGGSETRRGLKHFSPGAKLYCFPPLWGDGYEKLQVVGRHRGSHQYVTTIVPSRWLTHWRAQLVYSPHVVAALEGHWDGTTRSRERAETLAESMRLRSVGGDPNQ